MTKLTDITVFFDNGDYLKTQINGTRESINDYYLGKEFNFGNGENDLMARATLVLLDDDYTEFLEKNRAPLVYKFYEDLWHRFIFKTDKGGLLALSNEGSNGKFNWVLYSCTSDLEPVSPVKNWAYYMLSLTGDDRADKFIKAVQNA